MNGKQWILIVYVFFSFFQMCASSLSLEYRVQSYVNLVSLEEELQSGKEVLLARSFALVKMALGVKRGEDFLPDEEVVLYWLRNSYLNPYVNDPYTGASLLHFAAYYGACEVMRFLLEESRLRPDGLDKEGKTALHWAVNPYYGAPRPEVLTLLIQAKKSLVHVRDFSRKTPFLHLSSYSEGGDVLLEAGAEINVSDCNGRNALFNFKTEEDTRYLCSRGINVNCPDSKKLTALVVYFLQYSSQCERRRKNQIYFDGPSVEEIEKGIQVLLQYGAYISRVHHPAYRLEIPPSSSSLIDEYRVKKARFLSKALGLFLRQIEEGLEWGQARSALVSKKSSMKGISPLVIFEQYAALIPFFDARHKESREIMENEKRVGILEEKEEIDTPRAFDAFLCRLSFSKYISPQLFALCYDAVCNKEKYSAPHLLSEEEKIEKGKALIKLLFSL